MSWIPILHILQSSIKQYCQPLTQPLINHPRPCARTAQPRIFCVRSGPRRIQMCRLHLRPCGPSNTLPLEVHEEDRFCWKQSIGGLFHTFGPTTCLCARRTVSVTGCLFPCGHGFLFGFPCQPMHVLGLLILCISQECHSAAHGSLFDVHMGLFWVTLLITSKNHY